MKHYPLSSLVGLALLGLCGCHDTTPPFSGALRVANGITDSTGLYVTIKGSDSFNNIAVDTASNISFAPDGGYTFELTTNGVSYDASGVDITHDRVTTVFAYGVVGEGSQGAFAVQEPLDAPNAGQSSMQVVHAAVLVSATAPSLNFYFVTPGDCSGAISAGTPTSTAAFSAAAGKFALAAGTYEICVADEGGQLLFDSGPKGIVLPTSSSLDVFQLAAFDAPSGKGNGSSLVLSLLDNNGGSVPLYNLTN